jgi:hypothetical protein
MRRVWCVDGMRDPRCAMRFASGREEKQLHLAEHEHGLRLLIEPRVMHPPAAFAMDMLYGVRMLSLVWAGRSKGSASRSG